MNAPSSEGIETWNYHMPWSDLLEKLIDEMRYKYEYQFAEAIGLHKTDLSKMKNEPGRLGTPEKPENLRKLVIGLILGKYPDHPPAIHSETQVAAFLGCVPYKLWRGDYRWRVFRDTGKQWLELAVKEAFIKQRELWIAGENKQEALKETAATTSVPMCYLTEEECNQLVQGCTQLMQGCTLISSVVEQVLARHKQPDQADN